MIYPLATVLLSPILFVQGRVVRRVTPQLPEPAGAREGFAGKGREMSLLIVGDSAAAGVGVEHQQQALSGHLVGALSASNSVTWKLLAKSGDDAQQLLTRLQSVESQQVYSCAVVSIGVNDVTRLTSARRWLENLTGIVEGLQSGFGVQRVYLSCLPPMHLFPALPQPLRWWLGYRARRFNMLLSGFAAENERCRFVEVPYSTDLSFVAADGFHPGAPAYKLWGETVAGVIRGGDQAAMSDF